MPSIHSRAVWLQLVLLVLGGIAASYGTTPRLDQQSGSVQTEPIDEPRSAKKEPEEPIAKGMGAIQQLAAKCSQRIIVNADALFKANRWTLNPDAGKTLDALTPLLANARNHPVRISAYIRTASDSNSQRVAEYRAITIRGWLVNHHYVPENTPIAGFSNGNAIAPKGDALAHAGENEKKDSVEIDIDTCK
jgi:outer membrane protein OmpA-like peptidoglycan-associated protein